jgi:hypothetical protein
MQEKTERLRERTRMNTRMRIPVYMHSSVLSLVVTNPLLTRPPKTDPTGSLDLANGVCCVQKLVYLPEVS